MILRKTASSFQINRHISKSANLQKRMNCSHSKIKVIDIECPQIIKPRTMTSKKLSLLTKKRQNPITLETDKKTEILLKEPDRQLIKQRKQFLLKQWLLFEINKQSIDALSCSLLPEIEYVINMLEQRLGPDKDTFKNQDNYQDVDNNGSRDEDNDKDNDNDNDKNNRYELYISGITKLYQIRSLLIGKHHKIQKKRNKQAHILKSRPQTNSLKDPKKYHPANNYNFQEKIQQFSYQPTEKTQEISPTISHDPALNIRAKNIRQNSLQTPQFDTKTPESSQSKKLETKKLMTVLEYYMHQKDLKTATQQKIIKQKSNKENISNSLHCGRKIFSYKPKITKKKIDYSLVDSKIKGYLKDFKYARGFRTKGIQHDESNVYEHLKKMKKTSKKIAIKNKLSKTRTPQQQPKTMKSSEHIQSPKQPLLQQQQLSQQSNDQKILDCQQIEPQPIQSISESQFSDTNSLRNKTSSFLEELILNTANKNRKQSSTIKESRVKKAKKKKLLGHIRKSYLKNSDSDITQRYSEQSEGQTEQFQKDQIMLKKIRSRFNAKKFNKNKGLLQQTTSSLSSNTEKKKGLLMSVGLMRSRGIKEEEEENNLIKQASKTPIDKQTNNQYNLKCIKLKNQTTKNSRHNPSTQQQLLMLREIHERSVQLHQQFLQNIPKNLDIEKQSAFCSLFWKKMQCNPSTSEDNPLHFNCSKFLETTFSQKMQSKNRFRHEDCRQIDVSKAIIKNFNRLTQKGFQERQQNFFN